MLVLRSRDSNPERLSGGSLWGQLPDSDRDDFYDWSDIWHDWWSYLEFLQRGESLLVTDCGFAGLAPGTIEEGDVVVLPYGGRQPMLLRPTAQESYTFLGLVFIPGIMNDELYRRFPDLALEEKEFRLV